MKTKFKKSKLYGIFQKLEDGSIRGYIERSFTMDWSVNEVRVWRNIEHARWNLSTAIELSGGKGKVFISRINSKECPVFLKDWHPHNAPKFQWRNSKFEMKKELTPVQVFTD